MNQTREIYLLAASHIKKKNVVVYEISCTTQSQNWQILETLVVSPYESKMIFYPWSGFPHAPEGWGLWFWEERGCLLPKKKKMLIRVFDGTFFPVHPERNVTWVALQIIRQKQAMTQVISLMELEDEFFLEAMDQVLNQGKKKKLPSHLDQVSRSGGWRWEGLRPRFLLATRSFLFRLTRWTTIHPRERFMIPLLHSPLFVFS